MNILKTSLFFLILLLVTITDVTAHDIIIGHHPRPRPMPAPDFIPPRIILQDANLQPIELKEVNISTEVVGRIAYTTVEMSFYNPNNRVLEGELQFPLLEGQTVIGLSLEMPDGTMREAVVVEKAKGREVFEDVTRARIDPALLEKTEGNNYKLRVYPLNPQSQRRVKIRYSELLSINAGNINNSETSYRLPLVYPDKLARLTFAAAITGASSKPTVKGVLTDINFSANDGQFIGKIAKENFTSNKVMEILIPTSGAAITEIEEFNTKTYFYTEVPMPKTMVDKLLSYQPELLKTSGAAAVGIFGKLFNYKSPAPGSIGILWDASASGKERNRAKEIALLDEYFRNNPNAEIRLQIVRDVAEPIKTFKVKDGSWDALRKTLEEVAYDGATSLESFVEDSSVNAYLLFSDGLNNYGKGGNFAIKNNPVTAIVTAKSADFDALKAWAENSGGSVVDLLSTDAEAASVLLFKKYPVLTKAVINETEDLTFKTKSFNEPTFAFAGILTGGDTKGTLYFTMPDGSTEKVEVRIGTKAKGNIAGSQWANFKIASLIPDYSKNKKAIERIGKEFSIVTKNTSLIVLDRIEDYIRYEITPPPELKKQYEEAIARGVRPQKIRGNNPNYLQNLAREWEAYKQWWKRDFPKNGSPREYPVKKYETDREYDRNSMLLSGSMQENTVIMDRMEAAPNARMKMAGAPSAMRLSNADALMNESGVSKNLDVSDGNYSPTSDISVKVKAWDSNADYIKRMKAANPKEIYAIYLDERDSYRNSPSFYLDVAELLFSKDQTDLALRVLSNLAEINLENRAILRILGYRLLQAGKAELAVPIFEKILDIAEEEPQSYRDLALAVEKTGDSQRAVDLLWTVASNEWSNRFPGIGVIALTEMNAAIARTVQKLNAGTIDPQFIDNMPLDLRIVLTWDMDNTDIDLHVVDPNDEEVYYGHKLSYQGGQVSPDCTQGYGPEDYSLKIAKPGTYKVYVKFYGHRQQTISDATTVQVRFFTHYGTEKQKENLTTLRLKDRGDKIFVGELTVK